MAAIPAFQVTTPVPRDTWRAILAQDHNAVISHTPAWIDCICATSPYEDATRLYTTPDGRQLLLPMVRHKSLPGRFAIAASPPNGWGIGGVVSAEPILPSDIETIIDDLAAQRYLKFRVHIDPLVAGIWEKAALDKCIKIPRVTHILDLAGGFDTVWSKRFKGTARTAIRKAEKSGLTVECDTTGKLVPVFYDLYMTWAENRAREKGLLLPLIRLSNRRRQPQKRFEQFTKRLGEACQFWVARYEGQAVAISILMIFGDHAFFWRNASNKQIANSTRANDLLQRMMIEAACNAGCQYYHLGESGGVESLMQYKERLGGEPYYYMEYVLENAPLTAMIDRVHWVFEQIERRMAR